MNEGIEMQISAFVDGELPENEAELLLRRMSQDLDSDSERPSISPLDVRCAGSVTWPDLMPCVDAFQRQSMTDCFTKILVVSRSLRAAMFARLLVSR